MTSLSTSCNTMRRSTATLLLPKKEWPRWSGAAPPQSFLYPTAFHNQFPRQMPVLVCPPFLGLSSQHSLGWIPPYCFIQLFTLVLCCPSFPLGMLQLHLFHVLRADHTHVHRHSSLKPQGVPLWPPDAQITGFIAAAVGAFPHLFIADPFCSREQSAAMVERSASTSKYMQHLLLLSSPFSHPHTFRQKYWKVLLNLQIVHLHEERLRHRLSCLMLLPPSASTTSPSLSARCQQLDLPTLAGTKPIFRNTYRQKNCSERRGSFWRKRTLHRTVPVILLPTASFSNPLLTFPRGLQDALLLSCCIPETSLPDRCTTQSPCSSPLFLLPWIDRFKL